MDSFSFDAIGTHWTISSSTNLTPAVKNSLHARIATFDETFSRFRQDSFVSRLSKESGTFALPPDALSLLQLYETLYQLTNGKVTPLIGQTLVDAGYDAAYSFSPKPTLHTPPRWEDTIAYDEATITMKQPALLDFGAAGKGYIVDIVAQLLEDAKLDSYLINAGGDIRHSGQKSVTVGLENPTDSSEVIGAVVLQNQSLCASATSKRSWKGLHHIFDPSTQQPIKDLLATWTIADSAMVADGLATALFFVPPEALEEQFAFTCARLSSSMELSYSQDFPVTFFEETDA